MTQAWSIGEEHRWILTVSFKPVSSDLDWWSVYSVAIGIDEDRIGDGDWKNRAL
jgi:hypothetical protein